MKKNYLLLVAMGLSSLVCSAYTHQLVKHSNEYSDDEYQYFYDKENRLDSATQYYVVDVAYDCYTVYEYDENGNMTRENGFQKLSGDDVYTHTTILEWGYDDQNRLISRTNYNLDPFERDEFMLGGVYVYSYDENGLMTTRKLYFDEEQTFLYETTYYTYDENRKCTSEEIYTLDSFTNEETFSSGTDFVYDNEGRLKEKQYTMLNFMTQEPESYGGEQYIYDENGNIAEWVKYSETPDNPSQREIYTYYEDLLNENIVYPITPDYDNTLHENSRNAIETTTIYSADFITGELGLYDVMTYSYAEIEGSGVDNVSRDGQISVAAFMGSDGMLYLKNVQDNTIVRIYDMSGRLVKNERFVQGAGIDVCNLTRGIYCVATENGVVKIACD